MAPQPLLRCCLHPSLLNRHPCGTARGVQAVGLALMTRFLLGWFARLNQDSQARLAEEHFEDPTSLKPVRRRAAPCGEARASHLLLPAEASA